MEEREDAFALRAFKVFWVLQFVVFSRILFRASSMDNARAVTERIFSGTTSTAQISLTLWAMLVVTFALHFTPRGEHRQQQARQHHQRQQTERHQVQP